MTIRWIYPFGHAQVSPLSQAAYQSLGTLGSHLYKMSLKSTPVIPGFVVPIEFFTQKEEPLGIEEQIENGFKFIRSLMRVGAKDSISLYQLRYSDKVPQAQTWRFMGCSPSLIPALILATGNGRFSWAAYAAFVEQFVRLIGNLPQDLLNEEKEFLMKRMGISDEAYINADGWIYLIEKYQSLLIRAASLSLPYREEEQLIFILYAMRRDVQQGFIKPSAVVVQADVLGNIGTESGMGIAEFDRTALEAGHLPMGAFVQGAIDAVPETEIYEKSQARHLYKRLCEPNQQSMQCLFPQAAENLKDVALSVLDALNVDHSLMEFTLQSGKLWLNSPVEKVEQSSIAEVVDLFVELAERYST